MLALGLAGLTACVGADDAGAVATGTVVLQLQCGQVPTVASRAGVDSDLALVITRTDGKAFADGRSAIEFAAGTVPARLELEVGTFNLHVYTNNQTTWATANDGRGEACHIGDTQVTVGEDDIVYCTYRVPMTNYAVALSLPERFNELFTLYSFSLTSGDRKVVINASQTAYFAPEDGFTYSLTARNTDGKTSTHAPAAFGTVEAGKCYTVTYGYGLDASSSNARVVQSDL